MINIILQSPTDSFNIVYFLLFNPILQIFYFGVFTGVLFYYVKNNAPHRMDVYFGKRIGNILQLHTYKQPSDKKTDMTHKGAMYYFDSADAKLTMKHGLFERLMFIFDEDNATPIKTTKPNVPEVPAVIGTPDKIIEDTIKNPDGSTTTTKTTVKGTKGSPKIKSKNNPVLIDLDTQWNISARKLYNWWKNKMMETTWRAIIGKTLGSDLGTAILMLFLGSAVGGLGVYSIVPTHIITVVQTTTHVVNHFANGTIRG